uniref:NADH-ubiquinone oxidoreductase chain 5 n=1 Tax=Noteridae sp. MJTNT-2012 TaxID=1227477 RepID=S4SUL7_9COLE|nr:NADH dehydrogenase subunit 5 [Noteridae sp. MJTNT-2012]
MCKNNVCWLSSFSLFISSFSCFLFGLFFLLSDYSIFLEWGLVSLNSVDVIMSIYLDWMSLFFMGLVTYISSMVVYYSSEYMSGDYNMVRFILLVLMFVLSMLLLIVSPNLISILLGWDGLGLVSYCLVIYYQNYKSYNAGMITILMNRVGDVMLLLSISWMFNYGGWSFIFYLDFISQDYYMGLICFLVIIAGMTKSAQIPFSSWLPAAMAAPTPVSALVHSSTLVTAGVYLLIRFSSCISGFYGGFLLFISVLTMFMSGLGANYEYDLKKIIALSTLSQLGLMMSVLSMGYYKLAFFHLLTHAVFKALLFMCAGSIIHSVGDNQDIRFMGGLVSSMPFTCLFFNISNLALCGMPFLAGFYSKDLILEVVAMSNINMLIFFLFFLSTGLTVSYSFRLVYYSMVGDFNYFGYQGLGDEAWVMLKSMMMMVIFVLLGGGILCWLILSTPYMICLPVNLKVLPLVVSLLGGWVGYEMSKIGFNDSLLGFYFYGLVNFFGSMWFMPFISVVPLNYMFFSLGGLFGKSFDSGWNEVLGGQGLFLSLKRSSVFFQFVQSSGLKLFLLFFSFWFIFVIILGLL